MSLGSVIVPPILHVPDNLTVTSVNSALSVSWTPKPYNPFKTYAVYVNGVFKSTVAGASTTLSNLTNGTQYNITIATTNPAASGIQTSSVPGTPQSNGIAINYLLVGGGGSGGAYKSNGGYSGGGGGGGVSYGTNISITAGTSLSITVGAGEPGGATSGGVGSNSTISGITTAYGGNGGTGSAAGGGGAGGSGNYFMGGNGGADQRTGLIGTSVFSSILSIVGVGQNVSGTYWIAGGGAGRNSATNSGGGGSGYGTAGLANTGGGGGGVDAQLNSGSGGSGVCIIWYPGTPIATGGTITQSGGNTYHTFASTGSNTLNFNYSIEYIVVGGGASGGVVDDGNWEVGGGGGAGGYVNGTTTLIPGSSPIPVTIGQGGAANVGGSSINLLGNPGGSTAFGTVTAYGGGGGGRYNIGGQNGASGGGGSGYGTQHATSPGSAIYGSQGNNGGYGGGSGDASAGGGGGGAGGVGGNGVSITGGNGGVGISDTWTGNLRYLAGGGGGSGPRTQYTGETGGTGGLGGGGAGANGGNYPTATSGTANTGGGGGGAGGQSNAGKTSGAGGSGVVIVRYFGPQIATGGTVTSVNGYTIHTFTSTGTFTA